MRTGNQGLKLSDLIIVLLIVFATIGGCETDFGGGSPDDDDTDISDLESVTGTIVTVTPERENGVSNIRTQITNELEGKYIDITGSDGFFMVQGNLSGTPELAFLDQSNNQDSLGSTNLNVFPKADVDLGNIRLENGSVVFEDDIFTTFEAEIEQNNCSGNTGSLVVTATNENTAEIQVQIINSTTIQNNGDVITCDDLLEGDDVQVSGVILSGNSVEAQSILR